MSKRIGKVYNGKIYLGARLGKKLILIFTEAVILDNDKKAESFLQDMMGEDTQSWLAHCRATTHCRLLPGPVAGSEVAP